MGKENTKLITITKSKCWNCNEKMKIAMVLFDGTFYGPEEFSKKEIEIAESKDVFLKKHHSDSIKETYLANTCRKCGSFIGQLFLHDYLYMQDEEYEII